MNQQPQYITVPARCGTVRGRIRENGVEEYLGIPYATAGRFEPPKATSWSGRLDCLKPLSCAPQPNYLGEKPAGVETEILGSEDCLNLNVWVQPGAVGHSIPVVVYVHGGGFQVGSNSEPSVDGGDFIRNNPIVYISVNYRLGVLGFLQTGEELGEKYRYSGNLGALDVLQALRWVHKNVEAFGGDPRHITLMGISAGAKMIGCLLNMPEVQKICYAVILESGSMQSFRDPVTARNIARRYEETLKARLLASGEYSREEICHEDGSFKEEMLLTLPMETLLLAQAEFCDHPGTTCWFGPVIDGEKFSEQFVEEWRAGRSWKGRALLGSCQHEMGFLTKRPDFLERKDEILENLFGEHAHAAQEKFEELEAIQPRGLENWERVLSDFMYRYYTDLTAKYLSQNGNRVWTYSFQYGPATHGMGFHYMHHNLESPDEEVSEEEMLRRRRVSREMRGMIRRFICTGIPEDPTRWPQYHRNSGFVKMVFDAVAHTESRPRDTLKGFPDLVYQDRREEQEQ